MLISGCTGFSLRHGLSLVAASGGFLAAVAFFVSKLKLQKAGSVDCGARDMWNLLGPGIEPIGAIKRLSFANHLQRLHNPNLIRKSLPSFFFL